VRKLSLWFLIIALIFLFARIGFAFQNEPDGFRKLKWGDSPTPRMKFLNKQDEWIRIYRIPRDKLELGDAEFYIIVYQFYTPSNATVRRLMGVGLYFEGKENFDILEIICKVKFGEPTSEGFYKFAWMSLDASVILTYDIIDKDGYLALGSTPIFQQYTQEKEKKQTKEAEKDW